MRTSELKAGTWVVVYSAGDDSLGSVVGRTVDGCKVYGRVLSCAARLVMGAFPSREDALTYGEGFKALPVAGDLDGRYVRSYGFERWNHCLLVGRVLRGGDLLVMETVHAPGPSDVRWTKGGAL